MALESSSAFMRSDRELGPLRPGPESSEKLFRDDEGPWQGSGITKVHEEAAGAAQTNCGLVF